MQHPPKYNFFRSDQEKMISYIGAEKLIEALKEILKIRHFEIRGEAAYQHGKVGGFYHAYMGQEAIQTGCVSALGVKPWYTTTYRCHALALLTGVTPAEAMAELYGKSTGNAKGRGGSMHLYSDCLLGGFGIVGGHIPIATGAGFTIKKKKENNLSICFLGDGASVQGAFHESLNLASLWNLPCLYVIENNQWGMGTKVDRAVSAQPIAEHFAGSYGIEGYSLDGMNFLDCYHFFEYAAEKIKRESRPILVEAVTERFRGHSISDPALYRTKEEFEKIKKQDPLLMLKHTLIDRKLITEDDYKEIEAEQKQIVLDAVKFADESPDPDPVTLEEDVFAP